MLQVKKISRSFDSLKAVNDLSFEVDTGEILGLLGPNGAGKTTTMRIITGFLSPDKGDVLINKISVSNNSTEAQKLIGYLPENNPIYKDMLVSEFLNVSANLKNIEKNIKKDSLDFSINATNIQNVYYKPLNELSKGYKQRVGLAAALLNRPKLLILDEPTEGLDPNQRTEIRKLITELSKEHTIILSTHVMQEAEALCSRLIIINNGKRIADGSVEEISRGKRNEKITNIVVEGIKIKSELQKIKGVKEVKLESKKGDKQTLQIITGSKTYIQPELSKVAAKNKWILWEIKEQKQSLESVFKELTTK
ncbi:hypothetical protein COV24_02635 [candidate division WWE3 bacterium CG10_big_fil_rev_8_21_14_0_10_32_10]|uniref:ABC transporter domain-containing protein n=1 Tax=candidate division WWE3 bacterium CG10_big_fil_rev_8_21_14_0_10_32_10 TaxID=1975090 RepID=A0A2H0RA68_UNCKA|nr:MAG: hypothetical protein COV24_02635 [candidate division WWE3 bacterium CG10_big_fil_rev_8_21_14_0_10_32_10]